MLQTVFNAYGITVSTDKAVPFGSGLINNTWKITTDCNVYILQRINHNIFKNPEAIAHNINVTAKYLAANCSAYLFVSPIQTTAGQDFFFDTNIGFFRLMPFVENSHTVDVVHEPTLAFEASKQFGQFTKLLSHFDTSRLQITLPDFHNLTLRYTQFEDAQKNGNPDRIKKAANLIRIIIANKNIADIFERIKINKDFKIRVTHHDTKISNVLFDQNNKGLCVIDLDTLMPGYFISDAGDMMRTYISPTSEEEKDFTKIEIRNEYFFAIAEGYIGEMKDELTNCELQYFVYAGKFMIYMQAIRFLTDYINNDMYYGAKYEEHNFVRAGNQMTLLQKLIEKENILQEYVKRFQPLASNS